MSKIKWTTGEIREMGQMFLDALVQRADEKALAEGIEEPMARLMWIKSYMRKLGLSFDSKNQLLDTNPPIRTKKSK